MIEPLFLIVLIDIARGGCRIPGVQRTSVPWTQDDEDAWKVSPTFLLILVKYVLHIHRNLEAAFRSWARLCVESMSCSLHCIFWPTLEWSLPTMRGLSPPIYCEAR